MPKKGAPAMTAAALLRRWNGVPLTHCRARPNALQAECR
jgi:hypothetical protein